MSRFVPVCKVSDVPAGKGILVEVEQEKLAVFHIDGEFHIFKDFCCEGAGFSKAVVADDGNLLCPHHGWRFDVREGVCSMVPDSNVTRFSVKVEGDQVLAWLP